MIPTPGPKPAQDVVVVERSPFVRMAFISAGVRLPGALYLHEDLPKAVAGLRTGRTGTLFVSRAVLLDAPADALMDLAGAMAATGVRCVVLLTRHDPRDVGGRLAAPVQWFLSTPFPPDVMVALAHGQEPVEDGAYRVGRSSSSTGLPTVMPEQPRRTSTSSMPALGYLPTPASPGGATGAPGTGSSSTLPTLPAMAPVAATSSGSTSSASLRALSPTHAELREDRLMRANLDRLNHFEVLGVSPDASKRDLLSAYLGLVRRFHPDLSASIPDARLAAEVQQVYRRVTEAWSVVGKDDTLQAYRMELLARGNLTRGVGTSGGTPR